MSKRTGTYIDVRQALVAIQADLGAIKEFFGIETPGPGYGPSSYKSSPVITRPGEPRQPGRARSEVPASPERQARSPHRVNASRQHGRVSAQGAIMKGE